MRKIPKSLINTKVLLDAYTNIREILNGKCNEDVCPHWDINFAIKSHMISNKRTRLFCEFCITSWDIEYRYCPCHSNLTVKDVFLRLDEVIHLLEERMKKEYSS